MSPLNSTDSPTYRCSVMCHQAMTGTPGIWFWLSPDSGCDVGDTASPALDLSVPIGDGRALPFRASENPCLSLSSSGSVRNAGEPMGDAAPWTGPWILTPSVQPGPGLLWANWGSGKESGWEMLFAILFWKLRFGWALVGLGTYLVKTCGAVAESPVGLCSRNTWFKSTSLSAAI